MERIINKTIALNILLIYFCTICIGQNESEIILKYSLTKKEYEDVIFSSKCFQGKDYQSIIYYDTIYSNLDTLYIILPDDREFSVQRGVKLVEIYGITPSKKRFCQYISYSTEKRVIVLKSNWSTFVFENKKRNKYKLCKVHREILF
ncbi:MAG: hypothetical protein IKO34_11425 [Bacteroidales bacterium]|nr:hypothetical protein [Bacteroidales bacterium]